MRLNTVFCVALALATFSAGAVAADPQKIALTIKTDKKTETRMLTPDELMTLLKGMKVGEASIKQALEAGQRDGRLSIKVAGDKPKAEKK
ncbi:MAG: hypothetical protein Q8J78_15560 [Moraxellaceae bacterium]|nr:hypothetical protein [Moraxellaceae bacterium]